MSRAALARTAPEPLSKDRLRLWLKLLRAAGRVEGALRERMRTQNGTTLPRFDVMATLARHPDGLRMTELSGHLRVSAGNVTGIVDRLVTEGLVDRQAVPGDRRALRVRMTAAGRTVFAAQAADHEAWVDELLGMLGPVDMAELAPHLDAIAAGPARPAQETAS